MTMTIPPGTYSLGPQQATLSVHTRRRGAAAKAGHDLLIEVTAWNAELHAAEDPAATEMWLTADSTSLRVREGTGGLQALVDDDKAAIQQTINDKVLTRGRIEFRSTRVEPGADGGTLRVHGELELLGVRRPIAFELRLSGDGDLAAAATLTQSDFGIRPYSAMFGALKVHDDVRVELAGRLPSS